MMQSWPKTYSATEAPEQMLDLVGRLMPLLLDGDHPTCALLREQYARASIQQVELTGVGFFIEFEVPADVVRVTPPNFEGGQVDVQVEGVAHGAGCVLFVRGGVLSMLEGFTFDDEWPERPTVVELRDPRPIAPPEKGGLP
jgi:hypothetical protein